MTGLTFTDFIDRYSNPGDGRKGLVIRFLKTELRAGELPTINTIMNLYYAAEVISGDEREQKRIRDCCRALWDTYRVARDMAA
jgi:hypothetical protein